MKQTIEAMPNYFVTFVVILLACVVCPLEGRVCTRVRAEKGVKTVQYPGECHNHFEANCGWFSFEKCNHTETVPCIKTRNISATLYRVVEECCPGYHRNRDKKCVPLSELKVEEEAENSTQTVVQGTTAVPATSSGLPDDSSVPSLADLVTLEYNGSGQDGSEPGSGQSRSGDDDNDDDEGFFLGLSHGAYAGIICGILFVACVALLTAVHYRKRRLQEEKKATVPADQEAAQRQQMIPMEKINSSPPAVTT